MLAFPLICAQFTEPDNSDTLAGVSERGTLYLFRNGIQLYPHLNKKQEGNASGTTEKKQKKKRTQEEGGGIAASTDDAAVVSSSKRPKFAPTSSEDIFF